MRRKDAEVGDPKAPRTSFSDPSPRPGRHHGRHSGVRTVREETRSDRSRHLTLVAVSVGAPDTGSSRWVCQTGEYRRLVSSTRGVRWSLGSCSERIPHSRVLVTGSEGHTRTPPRSRRDSEVESEGPLPRLESCRITADLSSSTPYVPTSYVVSTVLYGGRPESTLWSNSTRKGLRHSMPHLCKEGPPCTGMCGDLSPYCQLVSEEDGRHCPGCCRGD